MYNRYIPREGNVPLPGEPSPPPRGQSNPFDLSALLFGKGKEEGAGLASLWKSLRLDSLDSGDLLLILILLLLLAEGDELELVIALGLVLLLGLNGEESRDPE